MNVEKALDYIQTEIERRRMENNESIEIDIIFLRRLIETLKEEE